MGENIPNTVTVLGPNYTMGDQGLGPLKCSNCGNEAGLFVNGICLGCQYCLAGQDTAAKESRTQALRDVLEEIEREKFISRCPCMCHNHPFCDADNLKAKVEEMLANA